MNQTAVEFLADKLYDYLVPFNGKELHEIFQQALAMEQEQMNRASISSQGIRVVVERCSIIDNGIETFLPRKMVYLANFLKENSGRFVSREYILDNLWPNVCVDERTIDVHIRRLREVFPNIPIKTQKGVGYGWITDN